MKVFFKAIRNYENQKVKDYINKKPELVNCVAKAPPKKDDGQSPLQVAFKVANFEIAEYLISKGANVNFQETSEINEWTAPVIHDCIRATIFNCLTLERDTSKFEYGLKLLKLILSKEANPNSIDSYGNSCLNRVFLDSRQMIDNPRFIKQQEILEQLRSVFEVLINNGADIETKNDERQSLVEQIKDYEFEKYKLI